MTEDSVKTGLKVKIKTNIKWLKPCSVGCRIGIRILVEKGRFLANHIAVAEDDNITMPAEFGRTI